jgi:DNA-binding MarR family transcriptional regulator
MSTPSQRPAASRKTSPKRGNGAASVQRPEAAVAYLLKHLHHSLRQAVDESLRREKIDMSFAHLATLFMLESEPGIAGAELARRGFVTAQTMNAILRRMEEEGAIERRPHPTSARSDSWYVTRGGQSRLDRGKKVGEKVWTRLLSALADDEVAQFQNFLERCIAGMDVPFEEIMLPRAKTARKSARSVRR